MRRKEGVKILAICKIHAEIFSKFFKIIIFANKFKGLSINSPFVKMSNNTAIIMNSFVNSGLYLHLLVSQSVTKPALLHLSYQLSAKYSLCIS